MSRRVRNASLETRTARLKLAPRGLPYWVSLETGLHLGYRRLKGTGKWVVRFRLGKDVHWFYRGKPSHKVYEKRVIAQADDYSDADGIKVLTYDQAQEKARLLRRQRTLGERGLDTTIAEKFASFIKRGIEPTCYLYRHYDHKGDLLYV